MKNLFTLLLLVGFAFSLRAYTVGAGLPYFYDEDEAHHFNRTTNMAKSGDLNPRYFHKPSLHFYLRIPVVWAAAEWSKHKGYLNDISEIRTFNRYGIASYAFTASHPGVVKWNRAFSLILSLLLVVFTYYTAALLIPSVSASICAALAAAVSPPLISYAGHIGVDVLMSLMCLITVYLACLFIRSNKRAYLILSALFSGLAVSSKYNALPVTVIPAAAYFLNGKVSPKNLLAALILPAVGFFAASPYILVSLPHFIKDLSYEIWHYSVAGHVGHSAERGLPQLIFYINWFFNEALGKTLSILALIGLLVLLMRRKKGDLVFLLFPLLYFFMMVMQKANFTRNMLVMIPFTAILAACGLHYILNKLNLKKSHLMMPLLFILACAEPLTLALSIRSEVLSRAESRFRVVSWLSNNNLLQYEIALSGQLQLPPNLPARSNMTTIDQTKETAVSLYLNGFDRAVIDSTKSLQGAAEFAQVVETFPGDDEEKRIISNPSVSILHFLPSKFTIPAIAADLAECAECKVRCPADSTEGDLCWIKKRIGYLQLPEGAQTIIENGEAIVSMEVMTPWSNNYLAAGRIDANHKWELGQPGEWRKLEFSIPASTLNPDGSFPIYVERISSPAKHGLNSDKRRLGAAVRNIKLRKE